MPWIDTGDELQGVVMAKKVQQAKKPSNRKSQQAKVRKCRHCEQEMEVTADQIKAHAAECLKKERVEHQ